MLHVQRSEKFDFENKRGWVLVRQVWFYSFFQKIKCPKHFHQGGDDIFNFNMIYSSLRTMHCGIRQTSFPCNIWHLSNMCIRGRGGIHSYVQTKATKLCQLLFLKLTWGSINKIPLNLLFCSGNYQNIYHEWDQVKSLGCQTNVFSLICYRFFINSKH